jgi:glutamyl-tRNA synthetase
VEDETVQFDDLFAGHQSFQMSKLGDFVIEKADRTASYQLAVVLDDAAANVTHIVRGDDLIDSTPRQIMLYRALGMPEKIPRYMHLPLVVGEDGRRLAKRHGDSRLSHYREAGVSAQRVLGLMARWCGIGDTETTGIRQMIERFDINRLPRERVVFTQADDRWLRAS